MAEEPRKRGTWRTVVRVVLWVLAALLVLVIGLALSIPIAGIGSGGRLDELTNATIPNPDGPDVRAYVALPEGEGPHPTVIMIHEFWGLNERIVGKADLLAEEGYIVVAPDVFRGSTTGWIPRAIYQVIATPAEQVNTDLDAVVSWAQTQPDVAEDRIGVVGFCFGGRSALLYSLHNPTLAATVVFYGNPVTDARRLAALQGPVLGVFGGADTSIPLEDVNAFDNALDEAGVDYKVSVYPGQPHAFVHSAEEIATDPVQQAAWDEMVDFLDNSLTQPPEPRASDAQTADDAFGLTTAVRLGLSHLGAGH